jgi:hypothetical protein
VCVAPQIAQSPYVVCAFPAASSGLDVEEAKERLKLEVAEHLNASEAALCIVPSAKVCRCSLVSSPRGRDHVSCFFFALLLSMPSSAHRPYREVTALWRVCFLARP